MIHRGGVFDKIGNWFEQSLVMLQWLRLLMEEAESVCWEPLGEQGAGVDYALREHGQQIVVQCKTRSSGRPWYPGDFEQPLGYAARQLRGGTARYRFISNQTPAHLERAARSALQYPCPESWLDEDHEARSRFVRWLGCDPKVPESLRQAIELFTHIEVRSLSHADLNERIWEHAKLLAGEGRDRLLNELYRRAKPETLGREWSAREFHAEMRKSGVDLLGSWPHESTNAWVDDLVGSFVARADASRRNRPRVDRSEAETVAAHVESNPGIVLVHGPPGCGKSEVLSQVLGLLDRKRIRILPFGVDQLHDLMIDEEVVHRFSKVLGEDRGCVLIDQLDQAAASSPRMIPAIANLVNGAVRSGLAVVIGCRSVDAERDTQIAQVLSSTGHVPTKVLVERYSDAVVAANLASVGVPIQDLAPDVLDLLRNPLALSLALDLIENRASWSAAESIFDLVDAWCEALSSVYGAAFCDLLDEIADRMEADRTFAVGRQLLHSGAPSLVERLIEDGVLIADADGRVRPFHQVISDTRLARKWSKVADAAGYLGCLGPRNSQGLRHARRARLTVPLLVDRGQPGAAILRDLVWHPDVRPLIRHALLLGLADLTGIPARLVTLLKSWLDQGDRRAPVLATVVRGRAEWMDALDESLDDAWSSWPDDQRELLLEACAAVAKSRGESVARHLATWERSHPGTLQRSGWVFWHDPADDADALFDLRLDYLVSNADAGRAFPHNWVDLFAANPIRATRLLAALLGKTSVDELAGLEAPDWMCGFPGQVDVPAAVLADGAGVFEHLADWWSALDGNVPSRVCWASFRDQPALARIVNFLARALGAALSGRQLTWDELLMALPSPMRQVDGWLLLRVGAHVETERVAQDTLSAMARWFQADPRWARIQIGLGDDEHRLALAAAFLSNIAPRLRHDDFERLEGWLITFRDEWTCADELRRSEIAQKYGPYRPNKRGETAFLLLPELGRQRWSIEAERAFQELKRKFGDARWMFEPSRSVGGYIDSKIPDTEANRFSAHEWLEHFERAPACDFSRTEEADGSLREFSLETLIPQLRRLSERDPWRYADHARAFARPGVAVPAGVLSALVDALGRTAPPAGAGADWRPLPDERFAEIVSLPAFLSNDDGVGELARAVAGREGYDWPDAIVDRLVQVACAGDRRFHDREEKGHDALLLYRLNDAACVAVNALAAIARGNRARRAGLLDVAEKLVVHEDIGRRAAGAMLAWACRDEDPNRADGAFLRAASEPTVAAQRDISDRLRRYFAYPGNAPALAESARERLLGLLDHEMAACVEQGGFAAFCFRAWDILEHQEFVELIAGNPVARRAVAEVVANWLPDRDVPDWAVAFGEMLANDPDPEVGQTILAVAWRPESARLMENEDFLTALAASAAARRNPGKLIEACDRLGRLLPVAGPVLKLADAAIDRLSQSSRSWEARHNAEQAAAQLVRLMQEAEQMGADGTLKKAADLLDRMIEKAAIGPGQAWQLVAGATAA